MRAYVDEGTSYVLRSKGLANLKLEMLTRQMTCKFEHTRSVQSIMPLTRSQRRFKVCFLPWFCCMIASHLTDMEKAIDKLMHDLQEYRSGLEVMQNHQAEDSRSMAKQQKSTERYMAKKNLLVNKKDECNRNIRDLGVLPEEAFDKYVNERSDRVRLTSTAKLSW